MAEPQTMGPHPRAARRWLVAALLPFAFSAQAENWEFGGHLKLQYTHTDYRHDDLNAVLNGNSAKDENPDFRLKAGRRTGPWDFAAHYEVLGAHGDSLVTGRQLASMGLVPNATGLPDDRRRLFDFTNTVTDRTRTAAVQRLDRLSVGYSSEKQVLRFGRQAVSWGNGLAFQVLDFVNPFSPIAIDKDYKTGDDMLYGQWIAGGQNDVQAILLPRREPVTHDLEASESSAAAKLHARYSGVDFDFLLARHADENLIGAGLVKSLGGAVWRFDAAYTELKIGGGAISLVSNIDYSWSWRGKNVYGFIEYFRSGVGETDRNRYVAPDPELAARLARGELFTLARDYAALGLQIEGTPLVNVFQNFIWNLNDGGTIYQIRGVYDWRQNIQLLAGANLPDGKRGTEYGGIATAVPGAFAGLGRSVYLRMAYYF